MASVPRDILDFFRCPQRHDNHVRREATGRQIAAENEWSGFSRGDCTASSGGEFSTSREWETLDSSFRWEKQSSSLWSSPWIQILCIQKRSILCIQKDIDWLQLTFSMPDHWLNEESRLSRQAVDSAYIKTHSKPSVPFPGTVTLLSEAVVLCRKLHRVKLKGRMGQPL